MSEDRTLETAEEKQARIDTQIAKWIKNGYSKEDLFITPDGHVIYDGAYSEAQAFKDFYKPKDDEKSE